MTLDISAIINGLAARLDTISGLRVYPARPYTIDAPAVVFALEEIQYCTSMGMSETDDITIHANVFTQMASDRGEAQLYSYMQKAGPQSLWAAIDADDTLGGVAQFATVMRVRAPGLIEYAGAHFYGVLFEILVGVGE